MKSADKLRLRWSRKCGDILFSFPEGIGTGADARWLSSIFNQGFIREAISRGYDISTLKLEISPEENNVKFISQR